MFWALFGRTSGLEIAVPFDGEHVAICFRGKEASVTNFDLISRYAYIGEYLTRQRRLAWSHELLTSSPYSPYFAQSMKHRVWMRSYLDRCDSYLTTMRCESRITRSDMSCVQDINYMPNVSEILCGMHDDGGTAGSLQSRTSPGREFHRSVIRSEGHERMGGRDDDRNRRAMMIVIRMMTGLGRVSENGWHLTS
jgi:hypothetical protein